MLHNSYGELRSGWALLLILVVNLGLIIILSVLGGFFLAWSGLGSTLIGAPEAWLATLPDSSLLPLLTIFTNLISIASALLLFRLLYKRPVAQLGLDRQGWAGQLLFGCIFGALAITLVIIISGIFGLVDVIRVDFSVLLTGRFWWWMAMWVAVACGEELVFRGYIMTVMKTTRSKYAILLFPAVIFSLMHITNPGYGLFSLLNIFLIGLLFALLFLRTGRLWAPIGFHFAWNCVQGNIFGLEVSGMRSIAILQMQEYGRSWLTGGDFGPEGGLITTLVILLCFVYLLLVEKQQTAQPAWSLSSDLPLLVVK